MNSIYTDGQYLSATTTWHAEDSPWKASQILAILETNKLVPLRVAEVGCGAGGILAALADSPYLRGARFDGYDLSPQAINMASRHQRELVEFHNVDFLAETTEGFDLLLVIDVVEHIPNYLEFVAQCGKRADFKLFHFPLDLHVSSVLRNAFIRQRYTLGHIHYFTAESALATIRDAGMEIVDTRFTNSAFGLYKHHPTLKRAFANIPRWITSRVNVPLSARLFGGYSLLILAR